PAMPPHHVERPHTRYVRAPLTDAADARRYHSTRHVTTPRGTSTRHVTTPRGTTATATRGSLTRKHLPRHHNPRHVTSPTTPHGKTDSRTGLPRPSPLPHRHAKRLRQAPLAYRLPRLRKTTATATHYVPTEPENTREPLHITTTGPTHAPTNVREPENDHRRRHVTTWSPE
ncbi:hypothetical protein DXG01_010491, partial [Tephrocybe rancida]